MFPHLVKHTHEEDDDDEIILNLLPGWPFLYYSWHFRLLLLYFTPISEPSLVDT